MANPTSPNGENTAADTARRDVESVKQTAREDFDAIKHRAQDDFDAARREAGSYAEGQKNYAADQISGIASAFERVGDELKNSGEQSWAGRYASDAAQRLEDIANRARNSSLNEMVGDVERFGRERPAAFLAAAALMGFAASRFLMASAHRRSRPGPGNYSDPAYAGDPYYASRNDGSGYGEGPYDGPEKGEQS